MTIAFPRGINSVMGSSSGGTLGSGIQNVLNNLASFVRNFPVECHRHVIVITFILRNKHHTNIQIELQELEGGVKATGLFCLLGIGIGLGSLFIYKLYTRLFPKILLPPPTHASAKIRRPNSGDLYCQNLPTTLSAANAGDKVLAETPDSGISAGTAATGNQPIPTSHPETYLLDIRQVDTVPTQLHRRRDTVAEWLAQADLMRNSDFISEADYASDIYGNSKDAFKSLRSWRSSGYVSIDQLTGAVSGEGEVHGSGQRKRILNEQGPTCFRLDEDELSDGVLSITDHILVPSLVSENPEDELASIANDNLFLGSNEGPFHVVGKSSSLPCRHRKFSSGNLSADMAHRWLRRNHHSFGSDLSAASSGCTYRESLVSKGFSVDLGEDLTGIMTPPDGDTGALDHWTMSSMDQLHKELRKIQEDINYMNEKVEVLLSKEDAVNVTQNLPSADEEEDEEESRRIMIEGRSKRRRGRSRSLSSVRSRSLSIGPELEDELDSPDFIWDYHSDLALDKYDKPMFVVKRPCPVFSEDTVDLPAESLNSEANTAVNSEKRCTSNRCTSAGLNQIRLDSFGEACFEDEVCLGSVGLDSVSVHRGALHMNSPGTRELGHNSSALHDADPPKCSHLKHHVCDHQSCLPSFCFPNGICGHLQPQCFPDICSCCREKMLFSHPHHSCSSCHGLRRGRSSSARTTRKYDRPSSSGRCEVCSLQCQSCAVCQPHSTVCCSNSKIFRCKSNDVSESREQCRQFPNVANYQESNLSPALKPAFNDIKTMKTKNIGHKVNIRDYLAQDCGRHGHERNSDMRKGFDLLNRLWGISSIRKIQNDNYCNLRAVLYQALVHNLPILAGTGNFQHLVQKLAMAIDSGHSYLTGWKFGYKSVLPKEETVMKLTECLRILFEQVEAVAGMSSATCREQYLLALLNHSPGMDHNLLEGLKILMALKAIDLFKEHAGHWNAPSFMFQLFAKDSSKSIESFFTNNIDVIGNTRSMRAMELSLLGLTLGVRIEVIRPSFFNKEGFVLHYPDEGADSFDKVHIIQEEDWNHYIIPVMKYTD